MNKLKLNKHDGVFDLLSNGSKGGILLYYLTISVCYSRVLSDSDSKIIIRSMLLLIRDTPGDIYSSENDRAIDLSIVLIRHSSA